MILNHKPIGDYIRLIDERNTGLKANNLLGLTISKTFISSVANTIGTDMENYKIIRRNQFACSTMQVRRDGKMPVALLDDVDEAIISQAYPVFEVIDERQLLPEYLMMWFSRKEFDREACFYAIGGVRGSLEWDDFCAMRLPVPSIEKQREIVAEYNVIQNRIAINNKLIENLEAVAQAIYKQWFVDFEFPGCDGKPYRSNGGEMVESEIGELPVGWQVLSLSEIATYLNGLAMQNFETNSSEYIPVIKIRELSQGFLDEASDKASIKIPREYIIENGDIIFSWSGTLRVEIWAGGKGGLNQHLFKVTSKYEKWFYYLWTKHHLTEFIRIAEGKATTLGHIKREHLDAAKVVIPTKPELYKINKIMKPFFDLIIQYKVELNYLREIQDLLLAKMAKKG